MRWLLVAQDGWGLGHVSRQLGLARQLRRLNPHDEFLFLTYSEATHLIASEGFPSLKLPASQIVRDTERRSMEDRRRLELVGAIVNGLITTYQPSALVIDTFPIGLQGEFAPLLSSPCPRFLIAREVRNDPAHWRYQESLRKFDVLLAPYAEGEVEMPLPENSNAYWVGPILVRSRDDLFSKAEARQRLGLPQESKVCLVSFGGGGNAAYKRLEQWALQLAKSFPGWHFAFAKPPLLLSATEDFGLSNAGRFSYYPMAECYAAFDAAISTTGSSAYELAYMGIPSILIPSVSPQQIEDHRAKAQRIVGDGSGFVVTAFDSPGLQSAFSHFDEPQRLKKFKEAGDNLSLPNGAEGGAAILTEFIGRVGLHHPNKRLN